MEFTINQQNFIVENSVLAVNFSLIFADVIVSLYVFKNVYGLLVNQAFDMIPLYFCRTILVSVQVFLSDLRV